jgi:hypothetical protein
MANSSLVNKLRIKPGQRIFIINEPAGYLDELGPLPEGVELSSKPNGSFDFVQLFARNVAELNRLAPKAIDALKDSGRLWISFPKGTSKMQTDLTRDAGWDTIEKAPLKWVTLISINDVWSAFCLKPAA